LSDALGKIAIFRKLPKGIVPLGFPVRVADREKVRAKLFAHGIFPPVHWPIKGTVPRTFTASHRLAGEIMTLPCDQRYGLPVLERIVKLIAA
jgi:hypothetical protein